jgi:ATP-binding cassette subfamily F protein uup
MLAYALSRPSNLLVLDEPTNDLDLETLELLQEMLASYPGTLLLVSHDRDFLDRTVTSIVAHAGDGTWIEYAGGYSDMLAQRGHGVETLPAKGKTAAPNAKRPEPPSKRNESKRKRLSPTEQHLLKISPARIASLNEEIARLERSLADPDFYARDREGFAALGAELAKRQAELLAAEEEWLRLELKREEIHGA